MSRSNDTPGAERGESVFREYVLDVRIGEQVSATREGPRYRFEAPHHDEIIFDDPDLAELYAAIYFDVNGFQEEGTGVRGVPPEIIQAGRDTLAAYFLTQPGTDVNWVASFYGEKPEKIRRYASRVHKRAEGIRKGARKRGME